MTPAITICILLLSFAVFIYVRKKQFQKRFNRAVRMTVNYMFHERPGQYSGDRNARSGVFVFKVERKDDRLKNIVIRKVKPLHSALDVNLVQILAITFERTNNGKSDISVRFKVNRKNAKIEDLRGKRVYVSGVLNFEKNRSELFTTSLIITDLYQKEAGFSVN